MKDHPVMASGEINGDSLDFQQIIMPRSFRQANGKITRNMFSEI